jgi:hypothetical protein
MIENLIGQARRRFALNETMEQLAFAAAVCVAGFVLILIFGTQYLQWWTLALFAAAGIGIGAQRVYKRIPDIYATAVQLDQNAGLKDALSTATYYSQPDLPDNIAGSASFRESQKKQAEMAAASVQLDQAVPFVVPRSLYVMAALCVLASALVALRYGIGHGLDLRAPLTQLIFEDQAVHDAKKGQPLYPKSQNQWMQDAQSLLSKLGLHQDLEKPTPGDEEALNQAIEDAMKNPADQNAQNEQGTGGSTGKNGQTKAGESSNNAQTGDPLDNGDQKANEDEKGSEGASSKSSDANSKSASGKNGSPSNKESLLSRLKDAVSNMLGKSDKQDNSPSQKNQQNAKNEQQDGKGQAGKGAQQQGESQADAQDGQPDNDSQNGQQATGRLNSPANQSPSQGGSGIGSQDGSKETKAAAQLKAMGKISEIIGQRAATVSGETSVEVQSGAQKLHTEYSSTAAKHAETDGDVTRDEIPLALQAYVQEYFAEVRKSEGASKPKAQSKQ